MQNGSEHPRTAPADDSSRTLIVRHDPRGTVMVIRRQASRRSDTTRHWARRAWIVGLAGSLLVPLAVWMAADLVTAAAVAQLTALAVAVLAIFDDVVTDSQCPAAEPPSHRDPTVLSTVAPDRRDHFGVHFSVVVSVFCVVLLIGLSWWAWTTSRGRRG